MLVLFSLGIAEKSLLSATLIGAICGMLGTFTVLRKLSLIGDTLSHSILPGVVIGFFLSSYFQSEKNPWIILLSCLMIGSLSIIFLKLLTSTTRLKKDAALGVVLSSFFALGLFLMSVLRPYINHAGGIESYFFGNLATISNADFYMIVCSSIILMTLTYFLLRPYFLVSFDGQYASSIGFPIYRLELLFYTSLSFCIIISIQAVGVILVSALLIIPASTSNLLTERKAKMIGISVLLGGLTGFLGAFISLKTTSVNLPTGPIITLSATTLFLLAYILAPRHGILSKKILQKQQRKKIHADHLLKFLYNTHEEDRKFTSPHHINTLLHLFNSSTETTNALSSLKHKNLLVFDDHFVSLTDMGVVAAGKIVRNHRLWELYLTKQAEYKADHVHDDAEIMEHVLTDESIALLEQELGNPGVDPHGKNIPG